MLMLLLLLRLLLLLPKFLLRPIDATVALLTDDAVDNEDGAAVNDGDDIKDEPEAPLLLKLKKGFVSLLRPCLLSDSSGCPGEVRPAICVISDVIFSLDTVLTISLGLEFISQLLCEAVIRAVLVAGVIANLGRHFGKSAEICSESCNGCAAVDSDGVAGSRTPDWLRDKLW